jgi:hypothetical protein
MPRIRTQLLATMLLLGANAALAQGGRETTRPAPKAAVVPLQTVVWVNQRSRVYHCPGTSSFGSTRTGEYMSEAAARARGNRAAEGKACRVPAAPLQLVPLTPGEVWINTVSGLYHCPESRLYGNTKTGRFLPEGEARSAGYRPAGRRQCG